MITKNYIQFFKELEKNNHKEWFHAHKSEYDQHVKAPFLQLLEQLIHEIQAFDSDVSMEPKEALFRINRDVRFSKDKTPYNLLMKAGIAPGGKKSTLPGYYIGISAKTIHVGGGLFNVSTQDLKKIRRNLRNHGEQFSQIVKNEAFKKHFGTLKGERAKRIDLEFKESVTEIPWLLHKQFYAMAELPITKYVGMEKTLHIILYYLQSVLPLVKFLKTALA